VHAKNRRAKLEFATAEDRGHGTVADMRARPHVSATCSTADGPHLHGHELADIVVAIRSVAVMCVAVVNGSADPCVGLAVFTNHRVSSASPHNGHRGFCPVHRRLYHGSSSSIVRTHLSAATALCTYYSPVPVSWLPSTKFVPYAHAASGPSAKFKCGIFLKSIHF
jgi:hypothetical protein